MDRLQGKIALITGAARGIGAAIAHRFVDEEARVIINDASIDAARATASKVGGHAVAADVSDSSAVAAMFLEISNLVPSLHILVNNAGINGLEDNKNAPEIIARRRKHVDEIARGGPVETFLDGTVDRKSTRLNSSH